MSITCTGDRSTSCSPKALWLHMNFVRSVIFLSSRDLSLCPMKMENADLLTFPRQYPSPKGFHRWAEQIGRVY